MSRSITTLGSNIASINTQRRLAVNSEAREATFERLSSGLRINKASDDAAGLAVSLSLNASTRIHTQAIKNINDGISAIQIADSALGELTQVTVRIKELAEQAANGTFSLQQRRALNTEAKQLVQEYNRILASTKFNGQQLLGDTPTELSIQAGQGVNTTLTTSIGGDLARGVSTGNFTASSPIVIGGNSESVRLIDLNKDGKLDVVGLELSHVEIKMGNGDGTFAAPTSIGLTSAAAVQFGDMNGDNILDMVVGSGGADRSISIFMGNGDGTYRARTSYQLAGTVYNGSLEIADLNNDGINDVVTTLFTLGTMNVLLGNGNGTLKAAATYDGGTNMGFAAVADADGDGDVDVFTSSSAGIVLHFNAGDGTFTSRRTLSTLSSVSIKAGDFDNNGTVDIAFAGPSASLSIALGNGNGTFSMTPTFALGYQAIGLNTADLNGDGYLDIIAPSQSGGNLRTYFGNGDGRFQLVGQNTTGGTNVRSSAIGDINGDGALDVVLADTGAGDLIPMISGRTTVTSMEVFNLTTRQSALYALDKVSEYLDRMTAERGKLGAFERRLTTASAALQITRENYTQAESRITNADIAFESAQLVRQNIIQSVGAAVLAQANQQPSLALSLLSQ